MDKQYLDFIIDEAKKYKITCELTISIVRTEEENESIKYIISKGFSVCDIIFNDFTPDIEIIFFSLNEF